MAPGFDEGRRMTRSARRAHPEPTPEPPEPQESRSESEEPLDIEQERNANIEARIQRLQTVIQSRKDHLRDIFVLYNHRANPATYCTPEDFMDTSPDRSTADPPHMSPLLASLGEWRAETPPATPPMLDELPASVLEEDKLDLERLEEIIPKPVQATPPPVVVPVPVVVEDVEVASSYSDAQDMDIDDSSSPRPAPEPLQPPAAPSPAAVQLDDVPAPTEAAEPMEADGQEQEPPAEQPAAPSPSADSPMTEPPPSPPPPGIRAASVVSTHTPAPPAPESHHASPALVQSTPTPEPEPDPEPEPSPPAIKSPSPIPKEATPAPNMPSPPTPKEATPAPVPVERAPTSTPAPEVAVEADDNVAAPPSEELTSVEASASVTPAAREATPTPTPKPQEPTREPTPAIQAPSPAPTPNASTPQPKSPTPAPREVTPPARELTAPAREPATPAREPTASAREATASAREPTTPAREATASARHPTTPAREATPSVREATPVREPTPSEHAATPPPPAREPSPMVVAAPSPEQAAEAMDVDSDEASDAPETPPPAAVAATQPDVSATADEASDGMSTATVEAVLDNDGMQVDDEHAEAASNATTPRQSPTTVSPSALEPPPVARAPAVTFNSALFGRPSVPKAPEPHASNAYTSPQRRVTNPAPYVAPKEPPIAFDFTPLAKPPSTPGGLLVPESEFTRALALPPLAALPPTFNHTVKPAKLQRKREKERKEGAPPRKDGEKEFIPLGLNRWAALIRANPVHKHIKKAAKVLFTADWRLAQDELMFVRAMDRIGQLKKEQMWSFRQPKRAKQPVHIKVHWDYLLDEMKWMRTDYREERKWKVALAHELAQACKAWVLAAGEERPLLCARYRLRRDEPGALDDDEDVLMDDAEDAPPAVPPSTPPPEVPPPVEPMFVEGWQPPAYGTPDPLGPPSPERLPNYDADTGSIGPATYTHLEPAVDDAAPRPVSELIDEVAMKTEETEQPLGLGTSVEVDALDSDEGGRETTAAVVLDEGAALKDAGNNPTLATTSSLSKLGPYKALRDPILSLDEDELWIDFNDLRVDDAEKDKLPADGVPLPEIFPELDVYEPLPSFDGEIAMSILDIKNHPSDKRVDETFSGKLASTSIFMDTKPTLVGALNPAQNWRNGKWVNLEDAAIHPPSGPVENKDWDHHMSELFKMHGTSATPRNSSIPKMPPNAHLRASELPWTNAEDELLKSIVDRFPNNWHLVAEWFNSSRVTINMDRRSPWDCCERWHRKFGLAATDAAATSTEQPRSPSPNLYESSNARTLKRLASNVGLGANTEPRKRRRLLHLQDAVRKVSKKREQQQRAASQSKRTLNANVHETHTKIAKSSMSALELTRLKCERDSQERQRQQQANEAMRNVAAQHPAQRQMILAHQQQLGLMQRAPGQLAQLPTGMPRLPGAPQVAGMPPNIAALQNMSQAQRAQFMRAQQVMHQAQQASVAAAVAGSSSASPMLQSSSPQTSPPRPGPSGAANARPGSTAPTVPLDPAAFQVAQQQQALHAAMMQGYGSEEQMRQRIGIQNMLAGSSTAAPPPPGGNHAGS